MASAFSNLFSLSSASTLTNSRPSALQRHRPGSIPKLVFSLSARPKLKLLLSKGVHYNRRSPLTVRAELREVSVDGPISATISKENDVPPFETKDCKPTTPDSPVKDDAASEEPFSNFINQVTSLVKLVDSKDIVELQLKQLNCELLIRKKEAIPQAVAPLPPVILPTQSASPRPFSASAISSPTSSPPSPTSPPPVKSVSPSFPRMKSPMAGTFYRCPQPGAPPFVKVGDRVNKGQILCIIEAMKLMNEIEADQDGTIVDILVADAKPISFETELFVIQP